MTALLVRTSRAEWRRLWSVRSSWILAGATALVVVGFGTLIGLQSSDPATWESDQSAWDGGRLTSMFALFGILALCVVTSAADHVTGGIVPTLQWTPRRGVLFAARSVVTVVTTTLLGLVVVATASVMIAIVLPGSGLPVDGGVRTLGELALVFTTSASLAVGLGLATRSTAGGLVSVIGLVLVLPFLLAQLPYDWAVTTSAHLPGSGALFLIFGEGPSEDMTSASARTTLVVWAAAALVAGCWRLLRSDANK